MYKEALGERLTRNNKKRVADYTKIYVCNSFLRYAKYLSIDDFLKEMRKLYKRHGKDINFVGVILTNENVTLGDKERSSNMVTKLAQQLGLEHVFIDIDNPA